MLSQPWSLGPAASGSLPDSHLIGVAAWHQNTSALACEASIWQVCVSSQLVHLQRREMQVHGYGVVKAVDHGDRGAVAVPEVPPV